MDELPTTLPPEWDNAMDENALWWFNGNRIVTLTPEQAQRRKELLQVRKAELVAAAKRRFILPNEKI